MHRVNTFSITRDGLHVNLCVERVYRLTGVDVVRHIHRVYCFLSLSYGEVKLHLHSDGRSVNDAFSALRINLVGFRKFLLGYKPHYEPQRLVVWQAMVCGGMDYLYKTREEIPDNATCIRQVTIYDDINSSFDDVIGRANIIENDRIDRAWR